MNVLSIDVGIKNLAYCLFNIQNKAVYEITDWNIVNLCGDDPTCQHHLKTKAHPCGKRATFTKDDKFYCKIHAKSHKIYNIKTHEFLESRLKKLNLYNLIKFADNHNIEHPKQCTKTVMLEYISNHISDNFFENITPTNAKTCDLITLGKNLRDKLDHLLEGYTIDVILIENQISPLASRMKTLQGMIAQYFIMKSISTIHFISASNKLKLFIGGKKTSYKERKKLGIDICTDILVKHEQFQVWQPILNTKKKLDDFADAFLQGLYYLKDKNIIDFNV